MVVATLSSVAKMLVAEVFQSYATSEQPSYVDALHGTLAGGSASFVAVLSAQPY